MLFSMNEINENILTRKIGFVGVGRMGSNMARRLKDCGCQVSVAYDMNTSVARALAEELS